MGSLEAKKGHVARNTLLPKYGQGDGCETSDVHVL